MAEVRDYYTVLGLSKEATDLEIKSRYRELALKYHPDRNPGDAEAEEKFKIVSEAYEILGDGVSRAQYDLYGIERVRPVYEHLFNDEIQVVTIPNGIYHTTTAKGSDIWIEYINVPFAYERRVICKYCKGKGYTRASSCRCSWGPLDADRTCSICNGAGYKVRKYCLRCEAVGYTLEKVEFTPPQQAAEWRMQAALGDQGLKTIGSLYYKFTG